MSTSAEYSPYASLYVLSKFVGKNFVVLLLRVGQYCYSDKTVKKSLRSTKEILIGFFCSRFENFELTSSFSARHIN